MPSLSFSNKRKGAPIWLSFSFCPFRKTTHLKEVASIELATSKKGGSYTLSFSSGSLLQATFIFFTNALLLLHRSEEEGRYVV